MIKVDDFLDLKKKLFGANKAFHTFSLNSQKALVVVLKGLSKIPAETVTEELKAQGLQPLSCIPLLAEGNKKSPYCTYKVVFPQGTPFNAVTKIGHVFYTRVYWEKFFSMKPYTQCFRCQAFGHSSSNCNHQPRCVKCAGAHPSRECGKAPNEPPTCANCSGGHTANFTSCPALAKFLAARNKQSKNPVAPCATDINNNFPFVGKASRITPASTVSSRVVQGPSYRDALLTKPGARPSGEFNFACPEKRVGPPSDAEAIMETLNVCGEIGRLCDASLILNAARQLLSKLKCCTTKTQQLAAFIEVAQSLD